MALAQPDSQGPQNPGITTQVIETQQSFLPLEVTVLRAHNLPRLKTVFGKKRRFYVTVTNEARQWQTRSVRSVGQRVEWNDVLDTFSILSLSRITASLYAKRALRKDILVGRHEILCEPQHELEIILSHDCGHSTEPVTLFLKITVSPNASPSLTAPVNSVNHTAIDLDSPPVVEGNGAPPTIQVNGEAMQSAVVTPLQLPLSRTSDLPIETGTSLRQVSDSQTEMPDIALRHAGEAVNRMETWGIAVVKQVMDAVSPIAALHPYASLAWSLLSKIPETLLQQAQRDDNVRSLFEAISEAFSFVKDADALRAIKPKSVQAKILEDMLERVFEISKFITSYAEDVRVGKRTWKNIGGQVDGKITQYRAILTRLQRGFDACAAVTTEVTVLRIHDDLKAVLNQALEAEIDAKISELPYKGGWQFGVDEKRCLQGTREDFLDHIFNWVENPESDRGLVLFGQAGTGKSSIAHEVARHFEGKRLGSYFAFVRKEGSKDEAYQLFTTLACDLSSSYPAFKLALGKVLKDHPSLRGTRDRHTLFEQLLLEPLKDLQIHDPILIVIDGLDESGDASGTKGLHTFLAEHLLALPSKFRILITSRPEDGVEAAFAEALSVHTLHMDNDKLAAKTEDDILAYFQDALHSDVFKEYGVELAKAAERLFQWASVACRFIEDPPDSFGFSKKKVVQRLLGHSRDRDGQDPLDQLYKEVLEAYIKSPAAQTLFRSVMGQLFAAIEPLTTSSLIALRRHAPRDDPEDPDPDDSDCVLKILSHLGSVLSNVTSSDGTRPIVPLHTSFRDFLADERSGPFHVDFGKAHRRLAHSCLCLMLDNLKFNICKLESSYLANRDVPDLESRIAKHISPALSYACIYWDDHLEHVDFGQDLFMKVRSLFETNFLFWLEVLSIKNSVGLASPAMASLKMWLRSEGEKPPKDAENLLALVNDAFTFVRYFGMAMARSAPHIYISALPFAPSSSRIVQHYLHLFPHTLSLERGQLSHWPALEMVIQAHDESIDSVAFSPNGQRIASGSRDHTIRVWDATTGELVAGPFAKHTNSVSSVAFSPDGQRIVSASFDRTIRVWDAATGDVVAGPFIGHWMAVKSVAFSPDGKRIASASNDRTIRIWNASTGEVAVGPFTGHTGYVNSVVFSPDGKRIASASDDRTICLWDSAVGGIVAGPFTGHTEPVYSVAFSPDGERVVSASFDHTIRVWNSATGEIMAGPFSGHTDNVYSVAFSPDGMRIASASYDRIIRVWDAATGEIVAGPFTGHADTIFSIMFSPDGQRIASASFDRTIRVWDATIREALAGPFTGHADSVFSIALSPDGQRIASASADRTICIWDATTGEVTAGPFTGHTAWVIDISFSPDGQRVASASSDRTIRVWDAAMGETVVDPFTGHNGDIWSVVFTPDGQRIASSSRDRTIRVWDAATGKLVTGPFTGHTDGVFCIVLSSDGQRIASASLDCTIRVWDAGTGGIVAGPFIGHRGKVYSVAFSPNRGRIASASEDHTIRVWDVATGKLVAGPFTGHTSWVYSVAFSPDGQYIVSGSADRTIRMWDAITGDIVAGPFTGHTDSVHSVAFLPDGQRIASASLDSTIRMWDVEPLLTASALRNRTITIDADKGRTEDIEKLPVNNDGWVCGENGELLLWIPQIHRPYFDRSNTVWIAGRNYTQFGLSTFVHGSNWATVYVPSSSS